MLLPIIRYTSVFIEYSINSEQTLHSSYIVLYRALIKKSNLDKEVPENYWPVPNLPYLSKILEKVVATRLEDLLSTHKLHDDL